MQLSAILEMIDETMFVQEISNCRDKAVIGQYYSDGRVMHGWFWSYLKEKLSIKIMRNKKRRSMKRWKINNLTLGYYSSKIIVSIFILHPIKIKWNKSK